MTETVRTHRWPLTDYGPALRWQQATANNVRAGGEEALALLQHPPVYTLGRRVRTNHLLAAAANLRARGAEVIETDRGGDITFHGPGQLVAYPILDLHRHGLGAVDYIRALEETMIRTLSRFGIQASRLAGFPGVWVVSGPLSPWERVRERALLTAPETISGRAKIGAVGVHVQGGVTTHGLALNVDVDLAWYDAIVPCGIAGASVTSMQRILGASPGIEAVTSVFEAEFASVFEVTLVTPSPEAGREQGVEFAHAR